MQYDNVYLAFLLTLIAGLSTGLGGFFTLFTKKNNMKFLSIALGFSAGVMIYVSMTDLLIEAKILLIDKLGYSRGQWAAAISFFAGIVLIAVIDKIVPSYDNRVLFNKPVSNRNLLRTGLLVSAVVVIHNFPEGIASFFSTIQNTTLGFAVAMAIAIHNIPEGIAVSVPLYYATGSRKKAILFSFLSGLSEPLGAMFGYMALIRFLNDYVLGIIFASVAGIMVFISLDELLPSANRHGDTTLSSYGLIAGMIVIALSLLLFM